MKRHLAYALAVLACCAPVANAQDDDQSGGRLENFLQDKLSGDGRYIEVTGLTGALTAKATIETLTVSDDDGVWLTINDAVLDWNRLALVRGRFSVNTLSAAEIVVARKPTAVPPDPSLPSPETKPFQVPELPVAIELGEINVDSLKLAESVIGIAAELDMTGGLSLADGALDANLNINRLDRAGDAISLVASFANETSQITLNLSVVEADDGLIATALRIPGSPPLRLTAGGEGPVTDFTALMTLSTDGVARLAGQVSLQEAPAPGGNAESPAGIAFNADLGGDVTSLLASDYKAFFGPDTRFGLEGRRDADGRLEIGYFEIASDALTLDGSLVLSASGTVEKVRLEGDIIPPDGARVVLPLTGPRTTITSAEIAASLDAEAGNDWTVTLGADGLSRPDLSLTSAKIDASGTLDQGDLLQLQGRVSAALTGLEFEDDSLNSAVGDAITLGGNFALRGDTALQLSDVTVQGDDYTGAVDGQINGLDSGFAMDGTARIGAADLSRFSGLAGRDLGGSVTAQIDGSGAPLGGQFDFRLEARAQDLHSDITQLDPLIIGTTTLTLDAARNETGLEIDEFTLNGTALTASATGLLRKQGSDLDFEARLDDLARIVPDSSGPVQVKGGVKQNDAGDFAGDVHVTGPLSTFADLTGTYAQDGSADVDFEARLGQTERFIPQITGTVSAAGNVRRDTSGTLTGKARLNGPESSFADLQGTYAPEGNADVTFTAELDRLERFVPKAPGTVQMRGTLQREGSGVLTGEMRFDGPQSSFVDLQGTLAPDGAIDVTYDAKMDRIERFAPEITGAVTAQGTAMRKGTLWTVDADATGPAQIEGHIGGTWDQDSGLADIATTGQLELAAANGLISPNSVLGPAVFDLTLAGEPGLPAISGTVTTKGAKVAIPAVGQAIENINSTVTLSEGEATVAVTAALAAGGTLRINGPVTLAPPFQGTITTDLQQIVLTDNISFESVANGQLVFAGPLAGNANLSGRIDFGETNINLDHASGSVGAAPIPPLTHRGESGPVHSTRARAGLVKPADAKAGPDIGLDIILSAPNRVFARGRGLQAELGGELLVRGTTSKVAPSGQIELIRGNLDLLGRNLKLTKGLVTLQGKLEPYIEFEATTTTSEGTATMEIAGPLGAPEINVFSDPERPSEEALAMLIFGNSYAEMSPFAIAQMAASLARLKGKGGKAENKAREGLGADELDVGVGEGGTGQLGAGGYILDNVYTDFTVNTAGDTELNLNLSVSENFTVKGTVDNAGDTGVGVFFEKDY